MNTLVPQNIQSRTELANLSWIGNWMVSYQGHSPLFGCFQDSLIGSSELTRSDIHLDKYHAMLLFGNITPAEGNYNFDKDKYLGRELIGKFLHKINYPKKKAKIYMPQYEKYIKYDPDEIYVQINRGELISGSLDKSTVGQQVMGSIFHIINNEYGSEAALESIYNFHQIVSRFFLWRGFTIGIRDIILSEDAVSKIKENTSKMISEAQLITDRLNRGELVAPIGQSLKEFYEAQQLNALEPGDNFVTPILNDIDFRNNKMARLVFTGSKGKETNVININGAYGQTSIHGRRPVRNFSWGRTSPYFPRYDTNPDSLGYINSSYREGVESNVFPFAAGEARDGAISNALSTSVSGAQNRLSVKNLESIMIDNLRKSMKNENIVQPIYAENGIDARRTEKVKFLTALISDADMKENYHSNIKKFDKIYSNANVQQILDEEYEQLLKDRAEYREIYLRIESDNPGQSLIDNEQQMPINPFRIIEDVVYNYMDVISSLSKQEKILDPVQSINKVKNLCETIAYAYYNNFQEQRAMVIPEFIEKAITLLKILIRTYLCTSNLLRKNITNFHLDIIIDKIKLTFKNSLVHYGATVGIIAAQCLSEPMTQYVLDSRHRAGGGGGTKTNAIDRIKEILGAKPTDKMKNTSMLIMVKPEYETSKMKVQEISNYIEMMNFGRFVHSQRIFFEEYGAPVHSKFKHESKMIKDFEKYNLGIQRPNNLSKWCIRYELNKEELVINSMKLDTIITKIRLEFPEMFLVYSPENSDNIIIRCYLSVTMIKIPTSGFNENVIIDIMNKINDTVIRGIKDILYTEVINIAQSKINDDGSISTDKSYGIRTVGTNLEDVLDNPYIDKYRTQTDSIKEFEDMYGIEATRNKVINEMIKTMSSYGSMKEHCTIFADEMTYSGSVTSIQKTGLQIREMSNVSLRLSFQSPVQVIENAAINGLTDNISGISAPLVVGQTPSIGTTYNPVSINEKFVENYMKNISKNIEDEL